MKKQFYTYTYIREDGSPFYVGKGHGDRAYLSHKKQNVSTPKDHSRIKLLYWVDEDTTFAYEIYLIDFWGRKDIGTGVLHNRTDGGDGPSGAKPSKETRKKQSLAKLGKPSPRKGKHHTPEARMKMSIAKKGIIPWNKGLKSTQVGSRSGIPHTEETKAKLREVRKHQVMRPVSSKTRAKQSESAKRNLAKNPRVYTEERRKKVSESLKRSWANGRRKSG